ncbi:MAG TPA: cytochrome c [Burkholderiales bacterium]|nr:cytochrome c [Burkholderiales bacterium]
MPQPSRQRELVRLVRHDCGSCHGMTLQGGLGPALTTSALAGRPIDYLEATILRGRPGTAMPGWQGLVDADDARWIAQQLKNGFPNER